MLSVIPTFYSCRSAYKESPDAHEHVRTLLCALPLLEKGAQHGSQHPQRSTGKWDGFPVLICALPLAMRLYTMLRNCSFHGQIFRFICVDVDEEGESNEDTGGRADGGRHLRALQRRVADVPGRRPRVDQLLDQRQPFVGGGQQSGGADGVSRSTYIIIARFLLMMYYCTVPRPSL